MIYSEALDEKGRLLTLALRARRSESQDHELIELYRVLGFEACRECAVLNQVEALLASALKRLLPASDFPPAWQQLLDDNEERVSALVDIAAEVAARLSASGVPSMAVEAGGVMLGSELPFEAYGSGDIDLVVPRGSLDRVGQVCLDLGGTSAERGQQTVRVKFRWDRPKGGPLWLEVCDVPFDRNWVALSQSDRSPEWLSRVVSSRRDARVSVPKAEDALAFVAMHTSLHSFIRPPGIRLHIDVDRTVCDNEIDWERVLYEIEVLGAPTRAFISLSMARGLFGTPVPDDVLGQLRPSKARWKRIQHLLAVDGVVADGKPKLARARTLLLDALIDERPMPTWLYRVLVPPEEWMQTHFGREGLPLWRRHVLRVQRAVWTWRPR